MERFTSTGSGDGGARTWHIRHRDRVLSTQDELRDWLDGVSDRDRCVVVAERQSAGRGRGGRGWESPRGGLWASFSLVCGSPPDPFLGLLVARAALEAVRGLVAEATPRGDGEQLALKWPNDLMSGERKWGGVLADSETGGDATSCTRFGVGLNLEILRRDLPPLPSGSLPATSIHAEFGFSPSPREVLLRMLSRLDSLLEDDVRLGRARSQETMQSLISTIGRSLRWRGENGESHVGTAIRLEPSGALRVRLEKGRETIFHSGQVRHLRTLP